MLHDIAPTQLRVGMYIANLNTSWLDVSIWRRRFLISDQRTLDRVLACGAETVTIDDTRGLGLATQTATTTPAAATIAASPPERVERRRRPRPPGIPDAFDRARQTVDRSKAAIIDMFTEARLGNAVSSEAMEPLVEEIARSVADDRTAIISVTRLKTKNEYTYLHSVAVCALMMNLARELGMSPEDTRLAGMAGMLHDIGKMAVPDELLEKPGQLDADERQIVQTHPEKGGLILRRGNAVADAVLDVCLHHHERIDGNGYPHGLAGSALSQFARMAAICDVYDAVTSVRPYKRPWTPTEALTRMESWHGHFDEVLLRAFVKSLGIFPIGNLVRLRSNRLGIVLRENPDDPATPVVRTFYDIEAAAMLPIADVATDRAGDAIIRGEWGPHWFGEQWAALHERLSTDATTEIAIRKEAGR